jgi:hypothetical protein
MDLFGKRVCLAVGYTVQVLHYFGLNYWANNTYGGET